VKYTIETLKSNAIAFGVPLEWAIERRTSYLNSEIKYYKEHQKYMVYMLSGSSFTTKEFIMQSIGDSAKTIQGYKRELYTITHHEDIKKGDITGDMIAHAKDYPIENLIEVKRNMAKCINHSESHPSMNCKNNFAYCHACGWTGDVIDIVMKTENLSFVEAVKKLQ